MASASVGPSSSHMSGFGHVDGIGIEQLPKEIHDMKLQDDIDDDDEKDSEMIVIEGNGTEAGHVIVAAGGGSRRHQKQTISYMAERVVGTGSFGTVYQAKCLETGETVAIKKVLRDKRYKNRELQIMQMLDHPNVVALKHFFYSNTEKDELYLNLVLEYVPETVYRIAKHHNRVNQCMHPIHVKLYISQVQLTCLNLKFLGLDYHHWQQ